MKIGMRGHDVQSRNPGELCEKLLALGVKDVQLVAHKSFEGFEYSEKSVLELKDAFDRSGIHVAVFGCYIDPRSEAGKKRFLEHIRYASMLNADVIGTETATAFTDLQEDETAYQELVESFRAFTAEGRKYNQNIAVETVAVHPLCSPEKTLRLMKDVDAENLRFILDPANLTMCGGSEALPMEAIRLYGDRISTVHWKYDHAEPENPVLQWVKKNPHVTVITEDLHDEVLKKVLGQLRMI